MSEKAVQRPGGRSRRVQLAVHAATRALLAEHNRGDVTVPMIAARAAVTPSTIYRRWGDLAQLLADVALERMRTDTEPADTGNALSDLIAWAEQYADEMASGPGREIIRDMLLSPSGSTGCWMITREQVEVISKRANSRDECFPKVDAVMDRVVSPIVCAILFGVPQEQGRVDRLVRDLFKCVEP